MLLTIKCCCCLLPNCLLHLTNLAELLRWQVLATNQRYPTIVDCCSPVQPAQAVINVQMLPTGWPTFPNGCSLAAVCSLRLIDSSQRLFDSSQRLFIVVSSIVVSSIVVSLIVVFLIVVSLIVVSLIVVSSIVVSSIVVSCLLFNLRERFTDRGFSISYFLLQIVFSPRWLFRQVLRPVLRPILLFPRLFSAWSFFGYEPTGIEH